MNKISYEKLTSLYKNTDTERLPVIPTSVLLNTVKLHRNRIQKSFSGMIHTAVRGLFPVRRLLPALAAAAVCCAVFFLMINPQLQRQSQQQANLQVRQQMQTSADKTVCVNITQNSAENHYSLEKNTSSVRKETDQLFHIYGKGKSISVKL